MPKNQTPISADWLVFEKALQAALVNVKSGQYLVLTDSVSGRFVQFSFQGEFGVRAEVSGNHFLPDASKLNRTEMAWLKTEGWLAPTGRPSEATPEKDPDGSPNFFQQPPKKTSTKTIAALAVYTLADILKVSHPFFLRYIAFDDDGALVFDLGIAREFRFDPVDEKALMQRVAGVLKEITGLTFQESEKHLRLRVGELYLSVTLEPTPPNVHLFA
jgi:hypothetical protein